MTLYLPYHFWRSTLIIHQWLQCTQLLTFPPTCMIALLGALASATVRVN